jgi:hypothetical protein
VADLLAPGDVSPDGAALAGLWLSALERLVGQAAHEVNGALNGLSMNLEVVRLKARPGADAGGVARFADVAADELGSTMRQVAALLALTRPPRDGAADVTEVVRHVAALAAPVLAHGGVTLEVGSAGEPARTSADGRAVRLALVEGVLAAAAAVRVGGRDGGLTAEPAGSNSAPQEGSATDEPARLLRCIVLAADAPLVRLLPARDARLASAVHRALAREGIVEAGDGEGLVLRFPGA